MEQRAAINPGPAVIAWYEREGRKYDWRETRDPYAIWIAEVVFQQTRIEQGIAYYRRFMERFPNLRSLARAPMDDVLKHWEGLGYYSRARNLRLAAAQLLTDFGGQFPRSYRQLLDLKGVGPYTARAISSFAFGEEVGVVDGNVLRLMSRYLGDASPVDKAATRKSFQNLLDRWIRGQPPRIFNHGMMDFGSMICKPRQPLCGDCPLRENCQALKLGLVSGLPVKSGKIKRRERYFYFYLVREEGGGLLIRQRPARGYWAGLWEIPNRETDSESWHSHGEENEELLGEFKHVFSHFDMHLKVLDSGADSWIKEEGEQYVSKADLAIFAFPRAVSKIFEDYLK